METQPPIPLDAASGGILIGAIAPFFRVFMVEVIKWKTESPERSEFASEAIRVGRRNLTAYLPPVAVRP